MTTTTETAARFTLDEERAREWLAHSVTHYETGKCDREPACTGELADLGEDWNPRGTDEETVTLTTLVYDAQHEGIITGPGRASVEYADTSDESEAGYRWEVWTRPESGPWLTLTGHYEKAWHIGEPDLTGADAALAILREAVSTANGVLDDLDRYSAAQPLAVRAPEVAELLAALQRDAQRPDGTFTPDTAAELITQWLDAHGYDIAAPASAPAVRYLAVPDVLAYTVGQLIKRPDAGEALAYVLSSDESPECACGDRHWSCDDSEDNDNEED